MALNPMSETLLAPEERRQLLLPHIATRAELNEAEQAPSPTPLRGPSLDNATY